MNQYVVNLNFQKSLYLATTIPQAENTPLSKSSVNVEIAGCFLPILNHRLPRNIRRGNFNLHRIVFIRFNHINQSFCSGFAKILLRNVNRA